MTLISQILTHILPGEYISCIRARPHVLVVDDDPSFLAYASRVLESFSIDVHVSEDPLDALTELQAAPYDAILIDLKMPGMNGIEMIEYLRPRNPKLRIMLLSAHLDEESCIAAHDLGCDELMQKPCAAAALGSRITALVA